MTELVFILDRSGSMSDKGVRTKSWTKQRPQGGNRHIVHIRKESPRSAII